MKSGSDGLTFQWPERRFSWALLGFALLSLLVHAGAFFIFQIEYPPTSRAVPPPSPVALLAGGTEETDAVLRWIEAEDPALSVQAPEAEPPRLLEVTYQPSFREIRAEPIIPPLDKPPRNYPPALAPVAVLRHASAKPAPAPVASEPAGSAVRFDAGLARRLPRDTPEPAFHGATPNVSPARFLLGVDATGGVRYLFLQESSGDRELDEQAATHLRAMTFTHAGPALSWGMATIHWGSEAFESSTP